MRRIGFLVGLVLFLAPLTAGAEVGYVSDQLVVTLRDGTGSEYQTLESMRTDTKVEILGEDGRFLHVRSEKGNEGFVLRQYITGAPPKSRIIEELRQQKARLEQQLREATADETALGSQRKLNEELSRKYEELSEEHRRLVEVSGDPAQLSAERDRLAQELAAVQPEIERLREENNQLLRSTGIFWFLAGGGVLLLGWFVGKVSRGKRTRRF